MTHKRGDTWPSVPQRGKALPFFACPPRGLPGALPGLHPLASYSCPAPLHGGPGVSGHVEKTPQHWASSRWGEGSQPEPSHSLIELKFGDHRTTRLQRPWEITANAPRLPGYRPKPGLADSLRGSGGEQQVPTWTRAPASQLPILSRPPWPTCLVPVRNNKAARPLAGPDPASEVGGLFSQGKVITKEGGGGVGGS